MGGRFRLASPVTSLAAGAVALALLPAEFTLSVLAHQNAADGSGGRPR
jgi:hypothetical protein